ncbi:MAG: putative glycoside hydrolase [Patescibacteria group bacterium]|nr:putative glycoside hydrolase [Patescibacteria group bacterium]
MKFLFQKRNKLLVISQLAFMVLLVLLCFKPKTTAARTISADFPRLANVYHTSNLSTEEARSLSRWDAVVLGIELQYTSPDSLRLMRELNPDIIILAYVLSQEFPDSHMTITDAQHPLCQLGSGISDGWWLFDSQGGNVTFWPGTKMLNVTNTAPLSNGEQWLSYLPRFMHDKVMSTGFWDGIFYDNVWNDVAWLNSGNLDLNRDGVAETADQLNQAWHDGMTEMLEISRSYEGQDAIIVGNGGGEYYDSLNGRFIEEFPSALDGGWSGAMHKYFDFMNQGKSPQVVIINGKSSTGTADDYRSLRYILTSTLLDNGFASFDYGALRHSDTWWYDEYDVYLGDPVTEASNTTSPKSSGVAEGVWRRDFENGIVLVNSTSSKQTVDLGEGYEKLLGTQSPVNSGEVVSSVTLSGHDGIILLKRQFQIASGQYINGAFAKAFAGSGQTLRQGFFTYTSEYPGGVGIIKKDLNGDQANETVIGRGNKVQIYNSQGFLTAEFNPYGANYNRNVNLAAGDLNGDGLLEIVTGTAQGGGPQIRIFDASGKLRNPGFFAYAKNFRGGVNIALGDIDGDGKDEIIAGAGYHGGPHVRVFNGEGKLISSFFAYDQKFRGGVSVASGDINNDGKDEIVTGAGPGGGPHIRIFNDKGKAITPGFFAFDKTWRNGILVTVNDINQDGQDEILASSQIVY